MKADFKKDKQHLCWLPSGNAGFELAGIILDQRWCRQALKQPGVITFAYFVVGFCGKKLVLKKILRLSPKQVIRYLNWLVIFLSLVVGILGLNARQHTKVVVEWSTATEFNSVGFNLYRSENPVDPYIQINAEIIPASLDPLMGGSYKYEDYDVRPGALYYYQLEEVESSGAISRHGPIEVKAVAGGNSELMLAVTLLGVGILGLLSTRDTRRENHKPEIMPDGPTGA
jgi:hypothetical protein